MEAIQTATSRAAEVLGWSDRLGTIEPGKWADLCLWDVDQPAELAYAIAGSPLAGRFHHGVEHAL